MQHWQEASEHYKKVLKAALSLRERALSLAEIGTAGVKRELKQELEKGVEPIRKQLARLEAGEFRVAVVGLEKSGKSTFVNAWLENDLLPTKDQRCTFTTTQVKVALRKEEERLEVIVKTLEEFKQLKTDLAEKARTDTSGAINARNDLQTITQHESFLLDVIKAGDQSIGFQGLDSIARELTRYVADEQYAHAVKEVRLYTTDLTCIEGVVFADVPGLDSGLGKHIDQSREMLQDCDAVICVQDSRAPSLKEHEQKLVDFIREGDAVVGVASKLFVFANRIDNASTAEALHANRDGLRSQWKKYADLPEDHLMLGSAGGHLVLLGMAHPDTVKFVGDKAVVTGRLEAFREILGCGTALECAGIDRIKKRINKYLDEERIDVLQKRCDPAIKSIHDAARAIFNDVRTRFPENLDDAKEDAITRWDCRFNEWWTRKWKTMEGEINEAFKKRFPEGASSQDDEAMAAIRTRYQERVRFTLNSIEARKEEVRRILFHKACPDAFYAEKANIEWRKELYCQCNQGLRELAQKLSGEILLEMENLADDYHERLWKARRMKENLRDDWTGYAKQLEKATETLFLRFARWLVWVLLENPVGSQGRANARSLIGNDIELLDNYFTGEEKAFKSLKKYATWGRALLEDPKVRKDVLGIAVPSPLGKAAKATAAVLHMVRNGQIGAGSLDDIEYKKPEDPDEVVAEVESDFKALEAYLCEAVFNAAGFRQLRHQEAKQLRDDFLNKHGTWQGLAKAEHRAKNPILLQELPSELRENTFDIAVVERLHQLRLALEDASLTLRGNPGGRTW